MSLATQRQRFFNKWFGLATPVEKKSAGYFTTSTDIALIKSSIRMILGTKFNPLKGGERVMNRNFGSQLYRLQYEQNDYVISSLVDEYIINPIREYEPRVEVMEVKKEIDGHELTISIVFALVDDYDKIFNMDFALERI